MGGPGAGEMEIAKAVEVGVGDDKLVGQKTGLRYRGGQRLGGGVIKSRLAKRNIDGRTRGVGRRI